MAQQILSSFGKKGIRLGLSTLKADIEDTTYLSKYFVVAEFNPVFTAGKNPVSFNGSTLLAPGSEIRVECLDSEGNSLFIEYPQSNVQYADVAKHVISINIFDETYNGPGKLIFVGTTAKNEIVRWVTNIAVDKTLQNSSKVRFYNKPSLEVRGLLYPVVTNDIAEQLTRIIPFTGSFYSYPATPAKDTNRLKIDPKKTNVDYRISLNNFGNVLTPTLYPTSSFNTQMEGQSFTITAHNIQEPFSFRETIVSGITASFKVKKVLDSKTLKVSDAFFQTLGKDNYVSSINAGTFTASYTWVSYNTASDAYLKYTPTNGDTIYIKQSYAEIVYRNLKAFSGFIARHKLYRKSLVYPGDFQLVADEPLGALELLTDPITANQTYSEMGRFYNQVHIDKYWYTSSRELQLSHSVTPYIDAMKVGGASGSYMKIDGSHFFIVKADSPRTTGSAVYYPYESSSFLSLQGDSYNSNFIPLKAGSLYVLSMNCQLDKNENDTDAKVGFYFTSSIPEIQVEKNYINQYGLKIGEIATSEKTTLKRFADKQMLFFTPGNDYYGTLVIVPYHCSPTFSELSLKVYGDYGFSPDVLFTKVPFKLNVKNETFQLKAELFDVNSTLVYSDLNTVATFDPAGESLFTYIGGSNIDPSLVSFISGSLTISQSLFLPNILGCPQQGIRLLGWHFPITSPPSVLDGEVCFTDVTDLSLRSGDNYLNVNTTNGITSLSRRSIAVRFIASGAPGGDGGKRIFINDGGTKYLEP